MLDKSETDEFDAEHDEWYTLQWVMEKVLFETEHPIILKHLIDVLDGHTWEWVIKNARNTILLYFKRQRIPPEAQLTWWRRFEDRGLDLEVNPNNNRPQNPQGDM